MILFWDLKYDTKSNGKSWELKIEHRNAYLYMPINLDNIAEAMSLKTKNYRQLPYSGICKTTSNCFSIKYKIYTNIHMSIFLIHAFLLFVFECIGTTLIPIITPVVSDKTEHGLILNVHLIIIIIIIIFINTQSITTYYQLVT